MYKNYKFTVPTRLILFIAMTAFAGIIFTALANNSGMTGRTTQSSGGCSCHGGTPTTSTSLTATSVSGSFIFDPNSTNSFTINVTNSSKSAAGINIAIATSETGNTMAGTLSAPQGSGLQVLNNELTHTSRKNMSNGTASFTFDWTAPSQHGTYYLRAIGNAVNSNGQSNGDEWNWMTPQQITVKGITLTSPNGGQEWCTGSTQTISWNHTALQNVRIELSSNGGQTFDILITQSTPAQNGSYSWNIPTTLAAGNQYRIRVSDAANTSNGDASDANFTIGGAPTITTHPQSQNGCTGQRVTFSVNATGAGLTYQWRKNGTNINNANQSSYTINSLTTADAGTYDCIVSGQCGSPVTSNSAQLTVDISPTILTHPEPQQVCKGSSVAFMIEATGTDITYQWRKSGVDIPNATSNSLTLTNVSESDEGLYTCRVSGKCNPPVISNPASLTIKPAPKITQEPKNAELCLGDKLELSVTATGSDLSYQWRKNGMNIPNANNSTFIISSVTLQDSGRYDVIVRGSCEPPDTSIQVTINIQQKPLITQQPTDQTVSEGSNVTFSVKATNAVSSYQWRKSGVNIEGANSSSLTISNVKQSDAGEYDCLLTNQCGITTSSKAKLTIIPKGDGPVLSLSQNSIDFGIVKVQKTQENNYPALLKNTGSEAVSITEITITGENSPDFQYYGISLPLNIPVNGESQLGIRFAPSEVGKRTAIIKFKGNFSQIVELNLTGTGGFVNVQSTTPLLDFGNVQPNNSLMKNAIYVNRGNMPAKLNSFIIEGQDKSEFAFPLDVAELTIEADSEIELPIVFNPKSQGQKNAIFSMLIDNEDKISIDLIGNSTTSVSDSRFITQFIAYPNPINNILKIKFSSNYEGIYDLTIYNNLGISVFEQKIPIQIGENSFEWNLMDKNGIITPAGTYFVYIRNGLKSFNFKINIIR